MSDGSIEVFEGTAPDMVETRQNVPEQMTPILAVSPERGNMIRVLNMVARGDQVGVPVYADLRDSNDDPLPVSTSLQWEYSPSNSDSRFKVSREVSNLSFYQNTSFAEQANTDYVDESKHVLTQPEFEGSRRQMRGRVISTLKEYDELPLDDLGPRVRVDYAPDGSYGREWLSGLLSDLADDGLVEVDDREGETTARLRR